jgi:hypothetical protein
VGFRTIDPSGSGGSLKKLARRRIWANIPITRKTLNPTRETYMGRIYNDIVETVGHTPLVRLNKVTQGLSATVLLKCEFFNPLGSVKDRIGMSMIADAERRGILKQNTVIIEPTSGNTGIALAFVAAAKLPCRRQCHWKGGLCWPCWERGWSSPPDRRV